MPRGSSDFACFYRADNSIWVAIYKGALANLPLEPSNNTAMLATWNPAHYSTGYAAAKTSHPNASRSSAPAVSSRSGRTPPESKVPSPATRYEWARRFPSHNPVRPSSICKQPVDGAIRRCRLIMRKLNWRSGARSQGSFTANKSRQRAAIRLKKTKSKNGVNEFVQGLEIFLLRLRDYFNHYNRERSHQSLDYRTPYEVYFQ